MLVSDYSRTLWSRAALPEMETLRICFWRFQTGWSCNKQIRSGAEPVEVDQRETNQNTKQGSGGIWGFVILRPQFFFAINCASLRTWSSTSPSPSHLTPFQSPPSCSAITIPQKDVFKTSSSSPVLVPTLPPTTTGGTAPLVCIFKLSENMQK